MLGAFALGVALGAGSSVVPGPCGLAVLEAARRHGLARAVATALGAALGDATYATLGIVGIGGVLVRHPAIPSVLLAISGAFLIGFGVLSLRGRISHRANRASSLGGVGVGLGCLLGNPGALVTWTVIVGAQLAREPPLEQASAIVGIATGTFAWFSGLARLSVRGDDDARGTLSRLTAVASALLIVFGVVSLTCAVL
jgi:threonine/homoserine/homoserine lactone efflux protein